MNYVKEASRAEQAGELASAADLYFRGAIDRFVECDYEPTMSGGAAVGHLLQGLSAARRSKDGRRVDVISGVSETILELCLSSNFGCTSAEAASCAEWMGDVHLLAESESAEEHYDLAKPLYESASESDRMRWQMEEGNDYRDAALRAFFESYVEETDIRGAFSDSFETRLRSKVNLSSDDWV